MKSMMSQNVISFVIFLSVTGDNLIYIVIYKCTPANSL